MEFVCSRTDDALVGVEANPQVSAADQRTAVVLPFVLNTLEYTAETGYGRASWRMKPKVAIGVVAQDVTASADADDVAKTPNRKRADLHGESRQIASCSDWTAQTGLEKRLTALNPAQVLPCGLFVSQRSARTGQRPTRL